MQKYYSLAVAAVVLTSMACAATALTFEDVVISESYGVGQSTALCIIDFGTKSYAFRYRFDGSKTGLDMLLDLDVPNTGLDVLYTDWGSWGIFIDDFAYLNTPKRTPTGAYPGWAYYTSVDGVNWVLSSVGSGQRTLADGAWDGWSYTGYDEQTWLPLDPPPVTPVPEPSSLVTLLTLIGLGPTGLAASRIRERHRNCVG